MSHGVEPRAALELASHGERETIAFGRRLGALLRPGDLVLLVAPFGAGKTHLTKGIAAALGVAEDDVNSPSFVLINEYEADRAHGRVPIYHADLYRIETPEQLASVGLDDIVAGDGIAIVEWAEHGAGRFPREHLAVTIAHTGPSDRLIRLQANGARYADIVDALAVDAEGQA